MYLLQVFKIFRTLYCGPKGFVWDQVKNSLWGRMMRYGGVLVTQI